MCVKNHLQQGLAHHTCTVSVHITLKGKSSVTFVNDGKADLIQDAKMGIDCRGISPWQGETGLNSEPSVVSGDLQPRGSVEATGGKSPRGNSRHRAFELTRPNHHTKTIQSDQTQLGQAGEEEPEQTQRRAQGDPLSRALAQLGCQGMNAQLGLGEGLLA